MTRLIPRKTAIEHPWKRGGDDWEREMDRSITHLQERSRQNTALLEHLSRIVVGDPTQHEDGLETRLHLVERTVDKLNLLTVGQPGSRNSGLLNELVDLRVDINQLRTDLKSIRDDKALRVEVRRDWLTFWAPVIGSWFLLTGSVVLNLDKIVSGVESVAHLFRSETPAAHLTRIEKDIEDLKKKRGPEVRKRLKELEAEAKAMEEQSSTWH